MQIMQSFMHLVKRFGDSHVKPQEYFIYPGLICLGGGGVFGFTLGLKLFEYISSYETTLKVSLKSLDWPFYVGYFGES